ncbi:hypothetical protein BFRIPA_00204 (plasmid) [Peribacillus frigoritolerans]|uniref:helix-turn-helix domain-containing protein n=1 Tax=Peribacillus frigoritolerans TaxID=450367 RepID=UPI0030D380AC
MATLINQSVADKLEIDKKQVRRWVRYFEAEGILGLEEKRGKAKGLGKGRPRTAPEDPEEKITRLEAERHAKKALEDVKGG